MLRFLREGWGRLGASGDALQRGCDLVRALRPHQFLHLHAVAQKRQRGPLLDACYTPSRRRTPKVRALLEMLVAEFEPVPPWKR